MAPIKKRYVKKKLFIEEVRLPYKEELDLVPERWRRFYADYWVTSPEGACYVDLDGNDGIYARFTFAHECAVCPIIKIKNLRADIGDIIKIKNHRFIVLFDEYLFSIESIGQSCYRQDWEAEDALSYKASDVKKFIDKWLMKIMFC